MRTFLAVAALAALPCLTDRIEEESDPDAEARLRAEHRRLAAQVRGTVERNMEAAARHRREWDARRGALVDRSARNCECP